MPQRFRVTDDFRSAFRREGVVIFTDLFAEMEAQAVLDDILRLFELRFGEPAGSGLDIVMRSYEQANMAWRQCARRMQQSLAASRMASKAETIATLKKAGVAEPIFSTFPEMRIDMPEDERYRQPWHQDWRSGQGSLNAVTFWIALHDVSAVRGAIEVLPGSHLWGALPVVELNEPRRLAIEDSRVTRAAADIVEMERGECTMFSQMLVHRSGRNRSALPRFSCQLRYCDRAEPRFVANGYRMATSADLVWDELPDEAAMAALYVE